MSQLAGMGAMRPSMGGPMQPQLPPGLGPMTQGVPSGLTPQDNSPDNMMPMDPGMLLTLLAAMLSQQQATPATQPGQQSGQGIRNLLALSGKDTTPNAPSAGY